MGITNMYDCKYEHTNICTYVCDITYVHSKYVHTVHRYGILQYIPTYIRTCILVEGNIKGTNLRTYVRTYVHSPCTTSERMKLIHFSTNSNWF